MVTQEGHAGGVKSDPAFIGKRDSGRSWRERSMSARFAWCVTVLVFAAVMLSSETVFRLREAEEVSQQHAVALALASELRARVDREFNSVLFLGSGLVGYLVARHDRISAQDLERIMQEVYAFGRHVRNLAVAIGYRIAYVYPLAGNESILNRDYRESTDQWPGVRKAIESGKGVLAGLDEGTDCPWTHVILQGGVGGMAAGIDRIIMLLAGATNLREVALFPMNQQAVDLLMGAPAEATPKQLREAHLRVNLPEKNG